MHNAAYRVFFEVLTFHPNTTTPSSPFFLRRNLYRVLTVTTGLLVKLLIVPAAVPLVVADHRADDGAWLSSVVTAWDARTPRKYCNGPVSAGLSVVH